MEKVLFADGNGEGMYQITPYKSWKLKSETAKKKHQISIATHIEQAETVEEWKDNLFKTVELSKKEQQKYFEKTVSWWNEFWNRSYIFIQPENPDPTNPVWQMSRNYQLFRYQLGGNVCGEYPTKFNGGNLIFDSGLVDETKAHDPDWRQWGGSVFTAQNQRLLYWPMLKSGDFRCHFTPVRIVSKRIARSYCESEKTFWSQGAVYCEYTSVPGLHLAMAGVGTMKTITGYVEKKYPLAIHVQMQLLDLTILWRKV